MTDRNPGLSTDPVFLGLTRPPMRFGVTYAALLANAVFTMELFLLTRNLLILLVAGPIHGVCVLLCARDARFFDLVVLWLRSRLPAWFGTYRLWRASSTGPLRALAPGRRVRRRTPVEVVV